MNKTLLWLDDCRDPFENPDWLIFSPIGKDINVVWVQSYTEFVDWISKNGLPDGICFDHDLGDEIIGEAIDGKSGMDCAKWLVEYCMDNSLKLPSYNVQSANPVGKENIIGLLENFKKFN